MIDFRQCNYILTIAECRSFSRAAEQLYTAQPSLSRYIKHLESDLGIILFDRSKSPLELTEAGKCYVEYIKKFQAMEQEMYLDLSKHKCMMKNKLKIGALTFLSSYILPQVIPSFVESFPNAEIKIKEYRSNQIKNALLSGDIDLFITNIPPVHPELKFHTITKDRVLLITKRTAQLEQEYNLTLNSMFNPLCIDLGELSESSFVLLLPWQNMHTIANQIFKEQCFVPQKLLEAPSIISAISLTSRPHHFTFACESALRYMRPDIPLAYFHVPCSDTLASICVAYRQGNKNLMINEFCKCARRMF